MSNVLVMADYNPVFSGNFIASILALANKARCNNWKTIFMFPYNADGSEPCWKGYIESGGGYEVLLYDRTLHTRDLTEMLIKVIGERNIDLIHSHFSSCYNSLLWSKEIHKRVKILFHDHMDFSAGVSFLPQIHKQIKSGKRYREYGIGVISVMKRKSRFYFLANKRWYIPNGISFKRNVEHSLSREEYRRKLKLNNDDKFVLFLGWDILRKGVDIAIKAVIECRKTHPEIKLGMTGFGAKPSEKDINRIKQVIGIDPCQEGIMFLNSEEDMYALHRAADVYLSASRTEAFSYGILEAISQNVPVVMSNISGTKWAKRYSKCISFRNGNVDDCAKALLKALDARYLPSNKDIIVEKYNIDSWCEKVLTVYDKMMK